MKLFVPEIGSKIKLTKDWTFVLYTESRNDTLLEKFGKPKHGYDWRNPQKNMSHIVTIPEGTVMGIARVYIRQGVSSHSSLTFTIPKVENKKNPLAGSRFWASLSDVNQIEFEPVTGNDETLTTLREIHDQLKTIITEPTRFANLMQCFLGGKTINNIVPVGNALSYVRTGLENVKNDFFKHSKNKESDKDIIAFIESTYRKIKIKNLISDESESTIDTETKAEDKN